MIYIDVATKDTPCDVVSCMRLAAAGDFVYLIETDGLGACDMLCAVHGAEALEDLRTRVRLSLYAQRQKSIPPKPTRTTSPRFRATRKG